MQVRRLCVWAAAAFSLVAAECGWAEDVVVAEGVLSEMVISANRYENPYENVGSSVMVLDAGQIAQRKVATVLEVLRTVPGLEVSQSGGPGSIANVFIRGGNSSQTLVLIDGVRVNPATLGAFDFANLAAENIARIEVLRGPQSTLYGSEAIAGVISITTKRGAAGHGGSARVEGGDPEQWLGTAEVHGGNDTGDYSVSATWQEYRGLSSADTSVGGAEKDDFQNASASARLGYNLPGDGRADLTLRGFSGESDIDGFEGLLPADDPNATTEREGVAAGAAVRQPVTDWWIQKVTAGIYDEELTGKDPDTVFNNYQINNRNVDAGAQADLTPVEAHVVSLGYEFENRQGESEGSFDESADIHSIFGLEQWNPIDALVLTAGARLDDHSQFGSEPTYRGTASYAIPETTARLHGSAGTGFKAPTLSDLFFPGYGNPDLDPERSTGYDAGVEVGMADQAVLVDVTAFRNDFEDLIAFDTTTMLAANIQEANAQGVEVSGMWRVCSNAQVGASYTYTDTEDEGTGEPLARRPKHRCTLQAAFQPVARISSTVTLVAVQDRIDSDGTAMDDYERVDLTTEYAVNAHVYPYVRIENVLDQDYEEVSGFSSPGFTAIGGVRANW